MCCVLCRAACRPRSLVMGRKLLLIVAVVFLGPISHTLQVLTCLGIVTASALLQARRGGAGCRRPGGGGQACGGAGCGASGGAVAY